MKKSLCLKKNKFPIYYITTYYIYISYKQTEVEFDLFFFKKWFQDVEYVGDVYQDEGNQAALLLYRDKTDDALLMVSLLKILHCHSLLDNAPNYLVVFVVCFVWFMCSFF